MLILTRPGSSPLARGLHSPIRQSSRRPRIIPARAGFTVSWVLGADHPRDHPRSRGVYVLVGEGATRVPGSSPLARGLRTRRRRCGSPARIIPARAGFTGDPRVLVAEQADHPRSRGVYKLRFPFPFAKTGSSPLARGLRMRRGLVAGERGIIPARAGFTGTRTFPRMCGWDHPRSRGVYDAAVPTPRVISGSSPLARGLLEVVHSEHDSWGIIPARAGFTVNVR